MPIKKRSNKSIRQGRRPSYDSPTLTTVEESPISPVLLQTDKKSSSRQLHRQLLRSRRSHSTPSSRHKRSHSVNSKTDSGSGRHNRFKRFDKGKARERGNTPHRVLIAAFDPVAQNLDKGYFADDEADNKGSLSPARCSRAGNPSDSSKSASQVRSRTTCASSSHDLPAEGIYQEEPQVSGSPSVKANTATAGIYLRSSLWSSSVSFSDSSSAASTSAGRASLFGISFFNPFASRSSSSGTLSVNPHPTLHPSDVTSNPAPEVNPPDIFDGVSHLPVYHFLGRKRCFLLDGAGDSPDESEDTVSSIVSTDHSRHFSTRESRQKTPSNSDLAVDLTTSAIDVASAFPSVESSHTTGDSQSQHHTEFALASVEHDSPINRLSQHSSFDLHSADSNTETAPDDTSADRDSPIFLVPEVGACQQLPEESSHTESTPTTSSQTQSESLSATYRYRDSEPSEKDPESDAEYNPSPRATASSTVSRPPAADRRRRRSAQVESGSEYNPSDSSASPNISRPPVRRRLRRSDTVGSHYKEDSTTPSSSNSNIPRSPVVDRQRSQPDRVESSTHSPELIAPTADSVQVLIITPTELTANDEQSETTTPLIPSVEDQPPDRPRTMMLGQVFRRHPGQTTPSTVSSVDAPSHRSSSSPEFDNDSEDESANVDLTQHSTAASPAAESAISKESSSANFEEDPSTPSNVSASEAAADDISTPLMAPRPHTEPPFDPYAAFLDTSLPPSVMLDEATRQDAGLPPTSSISIDPMIAYTAEEYQNILHSEQMVLEQMGDMHRPDPMRVTAEEESLMAPLSLDDIDKMLDGTDPAKAMQTAEACKQLILSMALGSTTPAPPMAPAKRARKASTAPPEDGPARRTRSSTSALSSSASPAAPVSTRRLRSSDFSLPGPASADRAVDTPEPESWAVASVADKRLSQMRDLGRSWKAIAGVWNGEVAERGGKKLTEKEVKKRWGKLEESIGRWPEFDETLMGAVKNLSSELTAELWDKVSKALLAKFGWETTGQECAARLAALQASGRVEEKGKGKGKGRK